MTKSFRTDHVLGVLLTPLFFCAGQTQAQPSILGLQSIVVTGDNALQGGVPYGTFASFGPAFVNDVGTIVFYAQIAPTGGGDLFSIWESNGGVLTRLVQTGDTAPLRSSQTGTFVFFGDYPAINDSGTVAFRATVIPEGSSGAVGGIWTWSSGVLSLVALDGETAPDDTGATLGTFNALFRDSESLLDSHGIDPKVLLNSEGEIAFYADYGSSIEQGLWRVSGGVIRAILWDYMSNPDYCDKEPPDRLLINFHDFNAEGKSVVQVSGKTIVSRLSTLAYYGEPAAMSLVGGICDGTVATFPYISNDFPLYGEVSDTAPNGQFVSDTQVVFAYGTQAPDEAGSRLGDYLFSSLYEMASINSDDKVLFFGECDPDVGSAVYGLWLKDLSGMSSEFRLVAAPNRSLDGYVVHDLFDGRASFSINDRDQMVFVGNVEVPPGSSKAAFFAVNRTAACRRVVLREGESFNVRSGLNGTASYFQLGSSDAPDTTGDFVITRDNPRSGYSVLTHCGTAPVEIGFIDSSTMALRTGIFRYDIPLSADLNGDGIIDFADYLDFLNRFEAKEPDLTIDFNCDGIIDFGDYLDFLNAYNLGDPCGI